MVSELSPHTIIGRATPFIGPGHWVESAPANRRSSLFRDETNLQDEVAAIAAIVNDCRLNAASKKDCLEQILAVSFSSGICEELIGEPLLLLELLSSARCPILRGAVSEQLSDIPLDKLKSVWTWIAEIAIPENDILKTKREMWRVLEQLLPMPTKIALAKEICSTPKENLPAYLVLIGSRSMLDVCSEAIRVPRLPLRACTAMLNSLPQWVDAVCDRVPFLEVLLADHEWFSSNLLGLFPFLNYSAASLLFMNMDSWCKQAFIEHNANNPDYLAAIFHITQPDENAPGLGFRHGEVLRSFMPPDQYRAFFLSLTKNRTPIAGTHHPLADAQREIWLRP